MIFPTLSTSLLGFATLAIAAPHLHSRFESGVAVRSSSDPVEQGIFPRARGNNNNIVQDITITELSTTDFSLPSDQRSQDVELVKLVQEKIIVIDNSRQFRDNVRKNTFRNKNKNVNTVVIVVTEVIDQRDSNNFNTRYLTRQLQSNSNVEEQVIVVISESQVMTVGGSNSNKNSRPTRVGTASSSQSTGDVQQFATYNADAPAQIVQGSSNSQSILPSGVGAPSWSNAQFSEDPAVILEENASQDAFVTFAGEDQSQQAIVVTVVSS